MVYFQNGRAKTNMQAMKPFISVTTVDRPKFSNRTEPNLYLRPGSIR
jgi:hypothetical protein